MLQPGHPIAARLLLGRRARPMVMLNPVTGDDRAGAVAAVLAMHKDRTGRLIHEGERLPHLAFPRPADPFEGDIDESHAVAGGFRFFRRPEFVGHAQTENRCDPELFQAGEAGRVRLGAAVKAVVDPAKVGDAMGGRHPAIFGLTERGRQNRQNAGRRPSEKHASHPA
jgi:hypothetical protein